MVFPSITMSSSWPSTQSQSSNSNNNNRGNDNNAEEHVVCCPLGATGNATIPSSSSSLSPVLPQCKNRFSWFRNMKMQDSISSIVSRRKCCTSSSSSGTNIINNNNNNNNSRVGMTTSFSSSSTTALLLLQWFCSVSLSIIILIAVPLSFYDLKQEERFFFKSPLKLMKQILIGWTSLLHISAWLLLILVSFVGLFLAQRRYCNILSSLSETTCCGSVRSFGGATTTTNNTTTTCSCVIPSSTTGCSTSAAGGMHSSSKSRFSAVAVTTVGLGFALAVAIALQSNLQMIFPSWVWNPFLWGGAYRVYKPEHLHQALEGICIERSFNYEQHFQTSQPVLMSSSSSSNSILREGLASRLHLRADRRRRTNRETNQMPLCLKESQWKELSTEALSSKNEKDVDTVLRGMKYAKEQSGGILITVMSRDTVDAIEPLRQNVEGLLPFVKELSVVVFENDSIDGSRQAFYEWAANSTSSSDERRYNVDVIECEVPECRFNEHHRDFTSSEGKTPYSKTSAIGRMAEFRNRMVKHILDNPAYENYTHMIVLDIDLGVSLSPLGVLHTLGSLPNNAVASSGRQVWPGSFGTITPPYDFSAFQAHETDENKRLIALHQRFCNLKPKGDRWRNECNAVSPMHTMMVLGEDRLSQRHGEPYVVDSAFNGATIYPIDLIRRTGAQYDVGEDGQRCEHIGFNLALNSTMYVNPKWSMHVSPDAPGGPTGKRASQTIQGIASSPVIGPILFFQNMFCMVLFVYAIMTLSMKVLYLFWIKLVFGIYFIDLIMTCGGSDGFIINDHQQQHQLLLISSSGTTSNRAKQRKSDISLPPNHNPSDLERLLQCDVLMLQQLSPRKRKVSDFESPFCASGNGVAER